MQVSTGEVASLRVRSFCPELVSKVVSRERNLPQRGKMCEIETMRSSVCWAAILCLLAASVSPSVAQEGSEAANLRVLEAKLTQAYKQRQFELLASQLAEDFVITFEDGSTYSKTGYISYSATPSIQLDVAETSDLKVRVHGNTAVLTGAYHERGEYGGKPYEYHDRFTDVWMKIGGKWQLIASHYGVPVK
jgi:ketosteroid isomerase-like protein